MPRPDKPRNLRTALVLASIALVFFIGVIVSHLLFRS
jgi:hypothetical protein